MRLFCPVCWPRREGAGALPVVRVETLALAASLFFTLACNGLFWRAVLAERPPVLTATLLFAAGLGVALTALQFVGLALLMNRWTAKPVLAVFFVCTAVATYYMNAFTVFIDPDMLRNVLKTDVREASELLSFGMWAHVALYAGLPLALLWRLRIRREAWRPALTGRVLSVGLALGVATLALFGVYSQLAPLMRNHKEIRYLATPGNVAYSLVRALNNEVGAAQRPRLPVGTDATLGAGWAARKKPVLFVIVVGETARAANWGLSGYARQTTPELAQRDVINFAQTTSCGTNTEVSVPCMFSVHGRRHYDDAKIHQSESLLNVLSHAGFNVLWRDNQSGCKGACTGVTEEKLAGSTVSGLCEGERCLDEILLHDLDRVLADGHGNRVLVLHQLGNHGPAYFERYPAAFRRFQPTCDTSDIAKCSSEAIVNSYDNALLYTDHVLAKTIDFLKEQSAGYDTALVYLSDHGESLGENGLYLHGVPYAIAPKEQTRVPLVMWFSPEYARDFGVDTQCLRQRASAPSSHDNLFHSVLGLLDVKTAVYDAALDVSAACRPG